MAEKLHHRVADRRRGSRFCSYGKETVNGRRFQKYRSQT
jgi:hypothetical protein